MFDHSHESFVCFPEREDESEWCLCPISADH